MKTILSLFIMQFLFHRLAYISPVVIVDDWILYIKLIVHIVVAQLLQALNGIRGDVEQGIQPIHPIPMIQGINNDIWISLVLEEYDSVLDSYEEQEF